jgi:hypothetical protein
VANKKDWHFHGAIPFGLDLNLKDVRFFEARHFEEMLLESEF